jgi:hypothetical protein
MVFGSGCPYLSDCYFTFYFSVVCISFQSRTTDQISNVANTIKAKVITVIPSSERPKITSPNSINTCIMGVKNNHRDLLYTTEIIKAS